MAKDSGIEWTHHTSFQGDLQSMGGEVSAS